MKYRLLLLPAALALAACGKSTPDDAANAPAPTDATLAQTAPAAPAPAPETAEPSQAERERAELQSKLDYASMEADYIGDPKGQWASSAKASSSFGDADKQPPDSQASSTPWQATGAPNNDVWNNNSIDVGFDWIELSYDRPVSATEVRMVGKDNEAVESISKIELVDTDGTAHTVWSGLSDVRKDQRGARTWFVRKFDATPYQAKAVRLTFANNVASGYKEVDAVQLIGE